MIIEVDLPVLAAPMAGGPTTPDLVAAAADAGSFGFLAAGYRSAADLQAQLHAVRSRTDAFGVNLFAPNPVPVEAAAYARYRETLRPEAERYGVELPPDPREDDDAWTDKIDLLLAEAVPVVSFTFGIPAREVVDALHRAGSVLVQTVTSAGEAARAADAGMDALALQGPAAGGHSGTLDPGRPVPARPLTEVLTQVRGEVGLPIVVAGGVCTAGQAAALLRAGAEAVMVGTALLLAPEAGTNAAHRSALLGPDRGPTVLTRAFTGRPARAMRNRFVERHDGHVPAGYPALHHLTSPIRRAAVASGDAEDVNLWAGTGYRAVRERPVAATLRELAAAL